MKAAVVAMVRGVVLVLVGVIRPRVRHGAFVAGVCAEVHKRHGMGKNGDAGTVSADSSNT